MDVLPAEGNFITLGILRDIKVNLGVKDKEFKEFEVVINKETNRVTWNDKGDKDIEFEIGEKSAEVIIEELEKLDKSKKLGEKHFSLFEKFVKSKYN